MEGLECQAKEFVFYPIGNREPQKVFKVTSKLGGGSVEDWRAWEGRKQLGDCYQSLR